MRIVHLLWGLTYGGIETMVVNIANEQSRLGHSVALVVINDDIDERLAATIDKAVDMRRIGRPLNSHNPWYIIKLNRIISRLDADFIHFHGVNIPRLLRRRYMKHWCTTHHTTWRSELGKFFSDDLHLFAISSKAADDLRTNANVHPEVVMNGIPAGEYKQRDNREPDEVLRIAQIGRVNFAIKGQDITIEAVRILKERGICVHVDFIGDADSADAIRTMVSDLGLENEITLRGSLPQEYLKAHLKDYDLLVQPSRIEGFGLTVAEAMAARVPVAVSDLPPLLEVIDNGQCGIYFRNNDPADMAKAIETSCRNYDPERVDRACRRVMTLYDVSATARNYLRHYEKL